MEKKVTTKKNTKKPMTLLQAIERVVDLSRNSKMSAAFMRKAKKEIDFLSQNYGISERQAVLFCICMERGPRHVDYDDLASPFTCSAVSFQATQLGNFVSLL